MPVVDTDFPVGAIPMKFHGNSPNWEIGINNRHKHNPHSG